MLTTRAFLARFYPFLKNIMLVFSDQTPLLLKLDPEFECWNINCKTKNTPEATSDHWSFSKDTVLLLGTGAFKGLRGRLGGWGSQKFPD